MEFYFASGQFNTLLCALCIIQCCTNKRNNFRAREGGQDEQVVMDESGGWEGRKLKQNKSRESERDNKKRRQSLGVADVHAPEESPNQNKGCLNYEPDLGKTTRQTREGMMQIEEKEQLRNEQNINLITGWPFPAQTSGSRNRADQLHPAREPTPLRGPETISGIAKKKKRQYNPDACSTRQPRVPAVLLSVNVLVTRCFSLLRPAFSWHPPLNVTHYYSRTKDQGEWRCAVVHVQSPKKGSQTRERLPDRGAGSALNISRKGRGKKRDGKMDKEHMKGHRRRLEK